MPLLTDKRTKNQHLTRAGPQEPSFFGEILEALVEKKELADTLSDLNPIIFGEEQGLWE